jgi:hypothetical protein
MKYDLPLNVIRFWLIIYIIGLAALYGCCERIGVSSKSSHLSTEHTVDRKGRELINAIKYIKSDEWDSFIKNIIVINIDKENIARIGDSRDMSEGMVISALSSIIEDKMPSGIMLVYKTKSESCDLRASYIKQMCISHGLNLFMRIPTGGVGVVNIAEQRSDGREQSSWEEISWLVEATPTKNEPGLVVIE